MLSLKENKSRTTTIIISSSATTAIATIKFNAAIQNCISGHDTELTHELNYILLYYYKFALPRYGINNTGFGNM
jgi:hypothetical protein